MCTSDRSKNSAMKAILVAIISFCMLCFIACEEEKVVNNPADASKDAFLASLEALNKGDYDTYLKSVDMGQDMDTFQILVLKKALQQHHEWIVQVKDSISSVEVVDVKMKNDSTATIYCQYTFGDSTSEVSAQKMNRVCGVWKLRLRN